MSSSKSYEQDWTFEGTGDSPSPFERQKSHSLAATPDLSRKAAVLANSNQEHTHSPSHKGASIDQGFDNILNHKAFDRVNKKFPELPYEAVQ